MEEKNSSRPPHAFSALPGVDFYYVFIFILVISVYISYILTILICAYWLRPYLVIHEGARHNQDPRLREALVGEESSRSGMNNVEDLTPFTGTTEEEQPEQNANEDVELRQSYNFLKLVGEGRCGRVFMARQVETNELVAVKLVLKTTSADYIILREWMILRLVLFCPFVVQCNLRYETLESHCFVMEYLSGGTLANVIKEHGPLPEPYVRLLLAEIVTGTEALHNCGILIRDLKVENIMFDNDGHVKLIDFGSSEVGCFGGRKIRRGRADILCLSPEMLLDLPYDHAADLWALGLLLWELLIGKNPFQRDSDAGVMEAILYDSLPDSALQRVSIEASSLLRALLEKEPSRRIAMSGVKDHSFFRNLDWNEVKRKSTPLPPVIPKTKKFD